MLPKWSDSYSIDNEHIDAQHKHLFELAGEVEAVVDRSVSKGKIKALLTAFFYYMRDHFRDEEKYMESIGYPELEIHRKIHREIVESMVHLISTIKTTNDLKERLFIIAKKWLLEHILFEDMKITDFARTQAYLKSADFVPDFTYLEEKDDEEGAYSYICGCENKVHKVSLDIHQRIQIAEKEVRCKACNQAISFLKKAENV